MEQTKKAVVENEIKNGTEYCVELKCSDANAAYPYVWSPARVWIRGYDVVTKEKVFEETVGFCNKNNTGPHSRAGRLMAAAERKIAILKSAS